MNAFLPQTLPAKVLLVGLVTLISTTHLLSFSRLTNNDPFPVYSAGNPLAPFTHWDGCQPEQCVHTSVSFFRQEANKGRTDPFFKGTCDTTDSCNNCQKTCDKDVELGDIHGPWNMIALFYPEANSNTLIQQELIDALDLNNILLLNNSSTDLEKALQITECLEKIILPGNTDALKKFGFFSVPIQYRKYGIRFEFDFKPCWDFGLRFQMGVASIRQCAKFNDLTCSALGENCPVLDPDTGISTTCILNTFDCSCKQLVINGIMKQRDIVAKTLGLNIDDYCETDIDDIVLSAYWSHCYEVDSDQGVATSCWSHFTFTPYFIGHVSPPITGDRPTDKLFALPFGNDRHWAFGFTGGFTINFIESIMIGAEAGFTKFSAECYKNHPVPTHELQAGIFPRKATLSIEPSSNWTFGATLGAYHFVECLSAYIQFRSVHHCQDCIKVIDVVKRSETDTFVASSIKVKKMEEESQWNSHFVNVSLDYDISAHMALGLFWQAPVRQKFAYRPTTVMGSLICRF